MKVLKPLFQQFFRTAGKIGASVVDTMLETSVGKEIPLLPFNIKELTEKLEIAKTDEERLDVVKPLLTAEGYAEITEKIKKEGGELDIAHWVAVLIAGVIAISWQTANKFIDPITEKHIHQPSLRKFKPTLLGATELTTLWLRGKIEDSVYKYEMNSHGFGEDEIDWTKILTEWIPSAPDLIRLGVREAFDESLVRAAKKKHPTPAGLIEWGKKVGLTEDWADKFWYAHWVLPSPSQLYEMQHRKLIDRDELKKWLTLNDLHPLMVDNMMDISYNVFTRVDARRMFAAGVLTREELVTTYQKMGYNAEDAEKLTQWTEVYTLEPEKDLAKTEIIKALKIGEIGRDDALEAFQNMGYSEDEADLLITIYKTASKEAQKDMSRTMIEQLYKLRIINKDDTKRRLLGIGYNVEASEYIVQLIDYKMAFDLRLLPFSYVRTLFKQKYMNKIDFEDYMYALGYCERDVDMIVAYETKAKPPY